MVRQSLSLTFITLGLVGCAGQQTTQVVTPDSVAAELKGADLEGVRNVWDKLGETRGGQRPATFAVAGRPAGYAAGPFSAEVIRMDLDGSADGVRATSDAIVRVGDPAAWDWQLLAFLDAPDGWKYAGRVDLPNQRVGAPVPETRTLGPGRTWMLVQTNKQSTKAVVEREMAWHQVRAGRLVEVLRTPVEGHRVGLTAPFDVAYRAELLDVFLTPDNEPAVTMNLEVSYSNARRDAFPGLGELFRRSGVVRYVQDPVSGRFVLDAAGSDWANAELAALLTESADQFVHHNRVQLVDLAHSPDDAKKRWVARLVQDCASEDVRRELTALVSVEPDR